MNWREILEKENSSVGSNALFKEEPVDFETFVKSPNFCNEPSISPVQLRESLKILGPSPEKVFDRKRKPRIGVFVWGKGSGKGFCSVLIESYLVYLVLCYRNFHRFTGISPNDVLDFVNVGYNEKQAFRLFERFKNRILNNRWFLKNFSIYVEGRLINEPGKPIITVSSTQISFPGNFRALALNSRTGGWEDMTIIFWVCDEISAFTTDKGRQNAFEILNALISSTRELPYIGLVTSFPRLGKDQDPILNLYQKIPETNGFWTGSIKVPWQVKPKSFYSGKTFDFVVDPRIGESVKIPIEYKQAFETDPESAKARYLCRPSFYLDARFFEYNEDVYTAIHKTFKPIVRYIEFLDSGSEGYYVRKVKIEKKASIGKPVFISVDAGEKVSQTVLSLGHIQEGRIVVDGFIVWRPDEKKKIIVDISDITRTIVELSKLFLIEKVRFDHWNSSYMVSVLEQLGIRSEKINAGLVAFKKLKHAIYSRKLILPDCRESEIFFEQLFTLQPRGDSKPRSILGLQDIVDSVANLVDYFYDKIEHSNQRTELVTGSLITEPSFFSPEIYRARAAQRRVELINTQPTSGWFLGEVMGSPKIRDLER
jgi:hypothetical protein